MSHAVTGHVQSAVAVERSLGTLRAAGLVRLDEAEALAAVDGGRRKPEAR
jgi:hypothetical protein